MPLGAPWLRCRRERNACTHTLTHAIIHTVPHAQSLSYSITDVACPCTCPPTLTVATRNLYMTTTVRNKVPWVRQSSSVRPLCPLALCSRSLSVFPFSFSRCSSGTPHCSTTHQAAASCCEHQVHTSHALRHCTLCDFRTTGS